MRLPMSGYWIGDEDVSGIIIGDVDSTRRYQFWTENEPGPQRQIDGGRFETDREAIAWFKDAHPEWVKKGVEMRVFDGSDEAARQSDERRRPGR